MERRPRAALRECMHLLQRFADGDLALGEFEVRYWTERSRSLRADAALQFQLDAAHDFERDLSRYVPDPLPEVRQVEERELRRRASRALQAINAASARRASLG